MKKKTGASGKKPQSISGMNDIVPDHNYSWGLMTRTLSHLAQGFGFLRVEVPVLEDAALYQDLELDQGNLVTLTDPEGARIAIRPETLPSLMRAHTDHKIAETHPMTKWYYLSPVVTYDEAVRKFVNSWEYGFELFGETAPLNKVQLISLVWKFLKSVHLENVLLEINSVGKPEHRKEYEDTLRNFLQNKKYELCNDCVAALETYPMRVFRCKNLGCKTLATEAPQIVDYLDDDCRKEFTSVLEGLDELGIVYALNPMLVGKQGTSGVTFVVRYKDEHSEYFIGEGAGHDDISETATGKRIACFGFIGYLEVLRSALQHIPIETVHPMKVEVFLVPLGDLASKKALRLFSELWDANISVYDNFGNIGVKNQLKMAEASKATIALIIGQKEAMDEMVILRDVKSGMQEVFQSERIIEEVKKRLGRI